jgi:cytochrome c-type biogenesis protein
VTDKLESLLNQCSKVTVVDFSTIPLGLGIIFAFFGGLVSFVSPCVLPLVPAYIGYMGGRITNTLAAQVNTDSTQVVRASRWTMLKNGIAFVAGFTFVFVLLGLSLNAFIRSVSGANVSILQNIIGRLGGIVIILFGLHFMGILPAVFAHLRVRQRLLNSVVTTLVIALLGAGLLVWGFTGTPVLWDSAMWQQSREFGALWAPIAGVISAVIWLMVLFLGGAFFAPGVFWTKAMNTIEFALYTDTRRQMAATGQQGLLGSAMMGIVFSAGWAPCVGPIYGGILTATASLSRSVPESAIWLTAYCLGLGVPFLLTALMLDSAQGVLRRLQRHMHKIELVTGAFLIFIGVLVARGQLQSVTQQFALQFGDFSVAVETSVQENLEQLFGMPSSESAPATATAITQLPSDAPIRLDSTPSAGDQESALLLFVEDADTEPIIGLLAGNTAPNFITETDEGTPIALYDLRGNVVVLHFGSTTCDACAEQMQVYQTLVNENANFTVLAFSDGANTQTLIDYREQQGISFPMALDSDGAIHTLYTISQYPTNYLINREGLIVQQFNELPAADIRFLISATLTTP